MSCHNCARTTLGLFIRSLSNVEPCFAPQQIKLRPAQSTRSYITTRLPYRADRPSRDDQDDQNDRATSQPRRFDIEDVPEDDAHPTSRERPAWQKQKEALREKLNGEAWSPRKKLSPDTMEGIRHLNETQPDKFTTPILAEHFKVSPEAIRRILKSKWQPSDVEYEERMERWNKRGERIWTNLVEMGVKPPKKWREMGVGKTSGGDRPKWKTRVQGRPDVKDSMSDNIVVDNGDILPVVDRTGKSRQTAMHIPLAQRL
jgi:hypothetical protein